MTRYFRQAVQALEALIRRINDAVKRSFERAAESSVPAVLLFATLGLFAGLSFWLSPQVWLAKFDTVAARVRKLLDFGTTLLDYAAANPVVAAILAVIQHPFFVRVYSLLAVSCLLYLWVRDESVESVRERRIAAGQSLTRSERVHLFAHRLAAVIILLLLIFPGSVIFFADPFIVLMFALVLAVIYGAIRLFGWVIAALFE
jgi:hypothetical protein